MSKPIPVHLAASVGLAYVVSKGWNWQEASDGQIQIENCPLCNKGEYHLYMACSGNKDGLWMCHFCGKTGNLRTLQEAQGDKIAGVSRFNEFGRGDKKVDPLPDPDACHATLLGDPDAMDYLLNVRGFTQEIIDRQKLGLVEKHYFREAGEVRALVIPYLVNGNIIYAKFRTLPPSPKDFNAPLGHEAPLYNQEVLVEGLHEIIFVEGESNTLCMMSHGIENVVGVPGANMKKAAWIEALDRIAPDKIYILYDGDKVGQKAAQVVASRIGFDKCLKLVLPAFIAPNAKCTECAGVGSVGDTKCTCWKPGKDINEWFRWGNGSVEEFEKLKADACLFDVTGVASTGDALEDLKIQLEGKDSLEPTYSTPWEPLSKLLGWENGDVIDIVAPEKIGKTTFGLNIMEYEVEKYEEDGIIICLEMTQTRLARKWLCSVTGFDDSLPKTRDEGIAKKEALLKLIPVAQAKVAGRKGSLYFAYPQGIHEPEDVFKLIRDCVRRYGVKWVMFDNVQLLCDTTLKNPAHRTIHLSQISKGFAKIAKDYQIKLIRILQPKRIAAGNIVSTDDVDGSSQIAKDCDCMITLHRNPVGEIKKGDWETSGYLETEQSFDPKMLVRVGLSRYSCGGATTLEFDGATSQVREYNMATRKTMQAAVPVTDGYQMPEEKVIQPTQAGEIAL